MYKKYPINVLNKRYPRNVLNKRYPRNVLNKQYPRNVLKILFSYCTRNYEMSGRESYISKELVIHTC